MINNKYNINQRKTIYHLTTLISNYLFNVNDSSFSKIYRLIFEMWQFRLSSSQVASTGNWLPVPFIVAAVDRVTDNAIADNKFPLISVLQCNIFLPLKS